MNCNNKVLLSTSMSYARLMLSDGQRIGMGSTTLQPLQRKISRCLGDMRINRNMISEKEEKHPDSGRKRGNLMMDTQKTNQRDGPLFPSPI
ncbi:MAG: hypothetical protein D6820_05280 [Lentisphaerae bacterium]|nr:MAG: hypothetical protein D6820_05280 [Lentisphaerota bacterium]